MPHTPNPKNKAVTPATVITHLVDRLDLESQRYIQLAKDSALKALMNHHNTDHGATARQHLVRAETYKAAAALVRAYPAPPLSHPMPHTQHVHP